MQYFMYFSMFYHLNFYNIVEVPGRFILALSNRWCLYAACWLSWDILTLRKSLPENFRFISYWDLVPRLLGLCISYCFCLQHFIKFCYHSFLAGFSFMDIGNSQNSRGGNETIFIPLYHFTRSQRYLEFCMRDDYHVFLIAPLVFTRLQLEEIYNPLELPFDWLMMWS